MNHDPPESLSAHIRQFVGAYVWIVNLKIDLALLRFVRWRMTHAGDESAVKTLDKLIKVYSGEEL